MMKGVPPEPLFVLKEHGGSVLCCSFCPFAVGECLSDLFISGDASGSCILWNLALRSKILDFTPSTLCENSLNGDTTSREVSGVLGVGFLAYSADKGVSPEGTAPHENSQPIRDSSRPAFRLRRKAKEEKEGEAPRSDFDLYFFTQCRNQKLHVWLLSGKTDPGSGFVNFDASSIRMLYELKVPQFGFCTVASYPTDNGKESVIAVPHEGQGTVTFWSFRKPSPNECDTTEDEKDDSPADVNTEGMNPMDALIARSVAAEERERRAREKNRNSSAFREGPFVAGANGKTLLKPYHICTSPTAAGIKCGLIMSLTFKDDRNIGVSFESGHITLCSISYNGRDSGQPGSITVLTTIRAFPDSALTCLWGKTTVISTSAEGTIHCYNLVEAATTGQETGDDGSEKHDHELHLLWSAKNPRAMGGVGLQRHMVVFGGWDGTIRLLDVRGGSVISILTFHYHHSQHFQNKQQPVREEDSMAAINTISLLPSSSIPFSKFPFSSRQPNTYRLTAKCDRLLELKEPPALTITDGPAEAPAASELVESEKDDLVYVFASGCKDGTVGIWRIDLRTEWSAHQLLM
ncbi:hypothetical protein, conserved [Angomonas deanei]|uniref:WD domain, G-beta repeat n=1 Tax=Angomonas deanei TaxID=59799 RepID=A0A7G2C2Q7_9TRYP|nr:hypothetical protein, conserved [Angomonas deanei]